MCCSCSFNLICLFQGFNYVATGRSSSKRNAQANAANSFVAHLVYQGIMREEEIPNSNTLTIIKQMGPNGCSGRIGKHNKS
jgi:hypothetical protein